MGYRGKTEERHRARELRAEGWTMPEIAAELGVSRSSVSLWARDVAFEPRRGRAVARHRGPSRAQVAKADEIERLLAEGRARISELSERDLLIAGAALYAGEGSKRDGRVSLANSDPRMIRLHCAWLRRFFEIDEARIRVVLYLHEGLDLERAVRFWVDVTAIPASQFGKPYRAVPDATIRHNKHEHGCPSVQYSCSRTHRAVMGLLDGLLDWRAIPG
jgi:transcriptional regulator with XRE-family HTH domain